MRRLKDVPEWLYMTIAVMISMAVLEWVTGGTMARALKGMAIAAFVMGPLNRFWLLPPPRVPKQPPSD